MRIRASMYDDTPITKEGVISLLQSNGIDTTMCRYELRGVYYDIPYGAKPFSIKFSCPGDYLAYFSMLFKDRPSIYALEELFHSLDELEEEIECDPTVDHIADHAIDGWAEDDTCRVLSLDNLTTGKRLYGDDESTYLEYDEEDW